MPQRRSLAVAIWPLAAPLAAQTRSAWSPSPAAWRAPDLQGVWTSDAARRVPMQRPPRSGERKVLTDEDFAERKRRDFARRHIPSAARAEAHADDPSFGRPHSAR